MSISRRIFFCFCLVLLSGHNVFSQGAKSPFSSFGIGDTYGTSLAHNQGMGGVGLSRPQFWYINNQNPALLPYNTFTVFSAALIGEERQIASTVDSEKVRGGNLSYLAVAFPLKYGKVTTSVGLMPYTNVSYRLAYDELIEGALDTALVVESGNSGISQFYWSTGFKVTSDISLGIKASYVFGSINNVYESTIKNSTQQIPFVSGINENTYSRGFLLGTGFSYSKDSLFKENYRFSIGAVYDFRGNAPADLDAELYKISSQSGDTLQSEILRQQTGFITLPSSIGGGISFGKDRKWTLGIDYFRQNWNTFRSLNEDEAGLRESWYVRAGGEFIPDYVSLNYLKRVTYRIGASYERLPFLANGFLINDYAATFGLSLPAGRSSIDLAFRRGIRGNVNENGLRENYMKAYLGITINDNWFVKRKFD